MIFGLSKANQAQIRKARVHAARAKQIEQYKQSRAGTRAKQANQSKQSGQVTIKLSKVKQASKQSRTQIAKQSCSQPVSQRTAEQTYQTIHKTKTTTPLASQSSHSGREDPKSCFKIAQNKVCTS